MYVQTTPCRLNISLQLESWNCFLLVWEINVAPGASAPSCGANAVSWNPVTSDLFPHSPFFSTASYRCKTRWGVIVDLTLRCTTDPVADIICAFINFTTDDHEDKLGFKNMQNIAIWPIHWGIFWSFTSIILLWFIHIILGNPGNVSYHYN